MCSTEADADARPSWCPSCRSVGTMRARVRRRISERLAGAARVVTARDVSRATWDLIRCGVTGISWTRGSLWAAWGPPGSGKSTLTLQIAAEASRALRSGVAVASLEESVGPPMARRLSLAGLTNAEDCRIHLRPSLDDLITEARAGSVIVVDSLGVGVLTAEDLRGLILAGAPMVLAVLHVTKAGDYKGSTSIIHEVEVEIVVREGGAWESRKNRLGEHVSGQVRGVGVTSDQSEETEVMPC